MAGKDDMPAPCVKPLPKEALPTDFANTRTVLEMPLVCCGTICIYTCISPCLQMFVEREALRQKKMT